MASINASTSGAGGVITTADNTGILNIQTAGTTAVKVDASQNVGIGTTSPTARLHTTVENAGTPTTSGSATTGVSARFQNSSVHFDIGTYSSGECFIQPRLIGNNATNFGLVLNPNGGNVSIGTTAQSGFLTVAGSYAQAGTVGLTNYTIDTTPTATVVANGASVDFTLLSGMLVVNSWSSGGVTIWLMGGGSTSAVSSIIGTVGTMSYVYPYYRWTNNSGSSATFGFFCVRTRTGP